MLRSQVRSWYIQYMCVNMRFFQEPVKIVICELVGLGGSIRQTRLMRACDNLRSGGAVMSTDSKPCLAAAAAAAAAAGCMAGSRLVTNYQARVACVVAYCPAMVV